MRLLSVIRYARGDERSRARGMKKAPEGALSMRHMRKNAKRADKPGSVVGRSFILPVRYRTVPRTLPERGPGRPMAFLFALAPDGVYQAAVLPRRWWSLTPPFQLFPLRRSRRWESSFLRHEPSGRPAWPLASILPYGARTFLTYGWHTRDRLARFAKRYCSTPRLF